MAHICKYRKNRDFWQVILEPRTQWVSRWRGQRTRAPGEERRLKRRRRRRRGCRPAVHLRVWGGCSALRAPRPSPSSSRLPGSRPWGPWPDQQGEPGHCPRTSLLPVAALRGLSWALWPLPLAPSDGRASRGERGSHVACPSQAGQQRGPPPRNHPRTPGSPEEGRGRGVCTPPRMGTRARSVKTRTLSHGGETGGRQWPVQQESHGAGMGAGMALPEDGKRGGPPALYPPPPSSDDEKGRSREAPRETWARLEAPSRTMAQVRSPWKRWREKKTKKIRSPQ